MLFIAPDIDIISIDTWVNGAIDITGIDEQINKINKAINKGEQRYEIYVHKYRFIEYIDYVDKGRHNDSSF